MNFKKKKREEENINKLKAKMNLKEERNPYEGKTILNLKLKK